MIYVFLILPAILLGFLPYFQVFLYLGSLLILACYKFFNRSKYNRNNEKEFWKKPLTILAKFWRYFGKIYHNYEIDGIEKIPKNGPAILVLYHPIGPIDGPFFVSNLFLELGRRVISIMDRNNFKIPAFGKFLQSIGYTAGTVESLVDSLKSGEIILIYPGGRKEALLSDDYKIYWEKNAGFAKVAQQARVPIIPIFTKNSREVYGTFTTVKEFFKKLYIKKKIPYAPVYGWFPVKLKTIVGDPISYDQNRTIEELVALVKLSLERMIVQHQRFPQSILYAFSERFH